MSEIKMIQRIKCFFGFHKWNGYGLAVNWDSVGGHQDVNKNHSMYLSCCPKCGKVKAGWRSK